MRLHHKLRWSMLVHISTNMWYEAEGNAPQERAVWRRSGSRSMRFDRDEWNRYVDEMKAAGVNTIILDVGDAVIYRSHPEIAVEGAWTVEELETELDRLNRLGFEVIPKLNFSTTHDFWMGRYGYMVSSPDYYQFAADIIREVCELFDAQILHLGMDEETYDSQKGYEYVVVRQNDLWWHDFLFFVNETEKNGARACMWSDIARHRGEEFVKKCPKTVIQCVWYYFGQFSEDLSTLDELYACRLAPVELFEREGFDQFPTGSSYDTPDNFRLFSDYAVRRISPEHLVGFMQTTWESVESANREWLDLGNRTFAEGKRQVLSDYADKFPKLLG